MVKHAKCTPASVSGVSDRSVRARDSLQGAPSNLPDDNAPPIGLYASRTLDVETWHRHLGHCNFGAIVDMARKGAVEGPKFNLSSPPKCDACIFGKQTRTPVPRVREWEKAIRPLERVFVDPIRPISPSGRFIQ